MNESYVPLIREIFKNEIQVKRVLKELQQLKLLKKEEYRLTLQNSNQGLKIIVDYSNMKFIIYLDQKFPFVFPKIFLQNSLTEYPSLSDGRDYIQDILQISWSPSVLLHQIVAQFPKFLQRLNKQLNDKQYLFSLGKFHKEFEYDLEDLMILEQLNFFACRELQANNKFQNKFLQVSTGFVVLYDVKDKDSSIVILKEYYQIWDLLSIKRKAPNDNVIIMNWKDEKIEFKGGRLQVLQVDECDACLETIINIMNKSGVKIIQGSRKIPEHEVTLKQYESVDIRQIVGSLEKNINRELNLKNVNMIVNDYQQVFQKVIEYYSAIGNPVYQKFVDRLQQFLKQEQVVEILSNQSEKENINHLNQINRQDQWESQ